MKMLTKIVKRLNPLKKDNWRVGGWWIFEDDTDFYQFLRPLSIILGMTAPAAAFLGGGILGALTIFICISVLAIPVALLSQQFVRLIGNTTSSILYGGRHFKDHEAIIKGRYKAINGMEGTGKYSVAVQAYKEFLKEYPGELDARFCLARLYDKKLKNSEKGLIEYRKLARKIREKGIEYKYQETLERRIDELQNQNKQHASKDNDSVEDKK